MCLKSDSVFKENISVKKELDPGQFDESIEDIKVEPLENNDENKSNLEKLIKNKKSTKKEISKIEVEKVDVDDVDYEETDEHEDDDGGEYNQSSDEEEERSNGSESDDESDTAFYTSESIKNEDGNSPETQQKL